jgi:hypothetical protein
MENFDASLMLEPVLANMVKSLAEFFGTTTDAVMANAPEFLAQYGWYHVITGLPLYIIIILLLGIGGGLIIASFFDGKWKVFMFIFIFFLAIIIVLGCAFVPVIVAPEFVGLDHLIYVITGKNLL